MDTSLRLMEVYHMSTVNPARAMKIKDYGLSEGDRADLVVLDASSVQDAILNQCDKTYVISKGKIIVKTNKEIVKAW
jgi:cytosine deaminase